MKNSKLLLGVLAGSAILASGCGNYGGARPLPETGTKTSNQSATRTPATGEQAKPADTDFVCPEQAQVKPRSDQWMDGTAFYTACTQKSSQSTVRLHGKTAVSDTVCLFPAQTAQNGGGGVVQLDSAGKPFYSCIKAGESGIEYKFDDLKFDAVYIVELPLKDLMVDCLVLNRGGMTSDFSVCPNFSYGVIR